MHIWPLKNICLEDGLVWGSFCFTIQWIYNVLINKLEGLFIENLFYNLVLIYYEFEQINFRFRKKNVSNRHTRELFNTCHPVSTTNTNTSSWNWDKWTNCSSCACLCTTASRSFTSSWSSAISERPAKSPWGEKLFINPNNRFLCICVR